MTHSNPAFSRIMLARLSKAQRQSFGRHLYALIDARGFKHAALAQQLFGIEDRPARSAGGRRERVPAGRHFISKWTHGLALPNNDNIHRLAAALQVHAIDLFPPSLHALLGLTASPSGMTGERPRIRVPAPSIRMGAAPSEPVTAAPLAPWAVKPTPVSEANPPHAAGRAKRGTQARPARKQWHRPVPALQHGKAVIVAWNIDKLIASFAGIEPLIEAHAAFGFRKTLSYNQVANWKGRHVAPAKRLAEVLAVLSARGPVEIGSYLIVR